jgi:Transposase
MNVTIGIDPHKASHTAVALDGAEDQVSSVKVRATNRQVDQLINWAECFEKRTWAIESAGGLGYLLAQQLVARGEGSRCPGHLGLAHQGAGHRAVEQERSQRCPFDRHRRPALPTASICAWRTHVCQLHPRPLRTPFSGVRRSAQRLARCPCAAGPRSGFIGRACAIVREETRFLRARRRAPDDIEEVLDDSQARDQDFSSGRCGTRTHDLSRVKAAL